MRKHKQGMLLCLFVLAFVSVGGQKVKVGEELQTRFLNNIVCYNKSQVHLDAYKGKSIILEFWSKTCAVCIKSFPKLIQLQKKYSEKLQIIAINSDSKEETKKLLEKQKIPTGIIPFVTEDEVMSTAFPRNYNPWVVWIDSSGTVRHITDGEWLSEENIRLFVSGQKPKLEENIFIETPKTSLPLFAADSGKWANKVVYYSYLSHCIKGLSIRNLTLLDTSQNLRITRNCKSEEELFKDAFGEGIYNRFGYANQVILHVRDSYSFIRPREKDTTWSNHYSYNYEISVPSSYGKSIYKMMQEDLQKVFNVHAEIKKTKIQSPVLIRTDSVDRIATKGRTAANNFFDQTPSGKTFAKNTPFRDFVSMLQVLYSSQNSNAPLRDATGYTGNIDIALEKIDFEKPDLSLLKNALNQFGLDIVMREVETEVLVIIEN